MRALCNQIVGMTAAIYQTISSELLPTPTKSHYTFNLRDMSKVLPLPLPLTTRPTPTPNPNPNPNPTPAPNPSPSPTQVFQGVLQSTPKTVSNANECLRLWSHECLRVFSDRMIESKDTDWFFALLCTMLRDTCKKEWSVLIESGEPHVLFGDFMNAESDDYVFIPDMDKLIGAMNTHLEDYNAVSKRPMELVLFPFAVEHVRRICLANPSPSPDPNP